MGDQPPENGTVVMVESRFDDLPTRHDPEVEQELERWWAAARTTTLPATAGGNVLSEIHREDAVRAVAWAPDGARFACGGHDKKASIYETAGWTTVKERACTGGVSCGCSPASPDRPLVQRSPPSNQCHRSTALHGQPSTVWQLPTAS